MATGTFTITAGAWVRGQVRREIERAAWRSGLEIRADESKGFVESVYRFTVTGDDSGVSSFLVAAMNWAKDNGA